MSTSKVLETIKANSSMSLEEDLVRLEHQLDTDVRDNLPPQLLAVVVGVLKMVNHIHPSEKEVDHEG
jgi:type III secretion system FlhB-like substrate exporter